MGDFTTRITDDLKKMEDGIGEKVGMIVVFFTIFLYGMGLSFYNGWKLTLVISSFIPITILTGGFMSKLQADFAEKEAQAYSKAGAVAEEVISSIRTVTAFGGEEKEAQRYAVSLKDAQRAMIRRSAVTGLGVGMVWLVQFSSFSLSFWYGTQLVLQSRDSGDGLYTPGSLVIIFFSILIGAINVGQAAPHIEALSTARGSAATVFSIIERKSEIDPSDPGGKRPASVEGLIQFKDVHFNYPARPDTQVLRGLSFTVRPGQTVALVGSSGCGKSTCVQLIQRFYDPLQGQVLLDGEDLRQLNVAWLRRQIGVVSQEPVLFGTTIVENIRYGRPDCTMKDIEQAAREANALDFIDKLPKRFETLVGQKGAQLSGGQKQRIAIARALVQNPKILLLDEATSALDLRSEALVQSALDRARAGRTTIVVAHRLSTVRSADLICALRDGQLAEMGTHSQLMLQPGVYHSLVTSQSSDTDEQDDTEADELVPEVRRPSLLHQRSRTISTGSEDHHETKLELLEDAADLINNSTPSPLARVPSLRRTRHSTMLSEDPDDVTYPPVSSWRILSMNRWEWPYLLFGVLAAAVMGACLPAYSVLFGTVLGNLSMDDVDEAMANARFYGLLFLAVAAVTFTASFIQTLSFGVAGERLTTRFRKLSFAALLRQEAAFFDDAKHSVGALCARLAGDASSIQGATGTRLGNVTQAFFTVALGAGLAFFLSWKVALAVLPFVPLCVLGTYIESKQTSGVSSGETSGQEKANKIAVEALSNIRTVAALGLEDCMADLYTKILEGTHKRTVRKAFFRGLMYGIAQAMPALGYAVMFAVGKPDVLDGTIPYSYLFIIGESLIYGTMVVGAAVAFSPDFSKAAVAARRIFALLDRKPLIDSSQSAGLRLPSVAGKIRLQSVVFRYPTRPEVTVLRGLDLEVSAGRTVALVGASGCGKSTCVQLLERFYDPDSGRVTLDDQDVSALNLSWLRSNIGIVSQEPVLFDRTIRDNIAYGDNSRDVPMAEIIAAARDANIHDFVASLPAGYETSLGSGSSTQLSGGQKQRIAIARALLRQPAVLLLDEATSALDTESEKCVQRALDGAARGRTCVVIAHRLSTIQGADRIAVIHQGRVVERGTHQQLLANRGHYYRMYKTMT